MGVQRVVSLEVGLGMKEARSGGVKAVLKAGDPGVDSGVRLAGNLGGRRMKEGRSVGVRADRKAGGLGGVKAGRKAVVLVEGRVGLQVVQRKVVHLAGAMADRKAGVREVPRAAGWEVPS